MITFWPHHLLSIGWAAAADELRSASGSRRPTGLRWTRPPRRDCEARLRQLVTELERQYPGAAACLAEDLPALRVQLAYPLRLRRQLRSTNLQERSLKR